MKNLDLTICSRKIVCICSIMCGKFLLDGQCLNFGDKAASIAQILDIGTGTGMGRVGDREVLLMILAPGPLI